MEMKSYFEEPNTEQSNSFSFKVTGVSKELLGQMRRSFEAEERGFFYVTWNGNTIQVTDYKLMARNLRNLEEKTGRRSYRTLADKIEFKGLAVWAENRRRLARQIEDLFEQEALLGKPMPEPTFIITNADGGSRYFVSTEGIFDGFPSPYLVPVLPTYEEALAGVAPKYRV
jgi:hypothetical protein